eukprot:953031-Rhodomonas_salina.3
MDERKKGRDSTMGKEGKREGGREEASERARKVGNEGETAGERERPVLHVQRPSGRIRSCVEARHGCERPSVSRKWGKHAGRQRG